MTRILLTPLVQRAAGAVRTPARLTALPTYANQVDQDKVTFAQLLTWNITEWDSPSIDLVPPAIGSAWVFVLTWGAQRITRTVSFSGDTATWEQLTDVDPSSLTPLPVNDQLASWVAVRDQLMTALDIPDLTIIFENGIA